ncbi:helix-turn-helix domain-containing protein [Nocardioides sp. B-3]|uniref:helix-turn-helix domain-containing protein n=1 Tax=Nocardioides sp. B-3 TaxID=2895565 RepID=UPI0021525AAD|nr:helix-turn-helix domain-containing protein [Nocardioides sp. B-3]UUZ60577.1 helix-turn-helix domain-containing protein [Nocardioides sp. B-3]
MSTRIDRERLIALRMNRGLAVRQLAHDCGIEIAVLNRLETSDDPSLSTLSVAALTRLADRLQVPVGHLFTDGTQPPADAACRDGGSDSVADAASLGALVTALDHGTSIVALADGLGWTTDRVHNAADALDRALRTVGMTVFRKSGLLSIRPIDDTHATAELAVRRHPRAHNTQRLASPARTKILYRAAHTPISPHSLAEKDRVNIATLLKAGVLIENNDRCFVPSPDVLASLHPEGM